MIILLHPRDWLGGKSVKKKKRAEKKYLAWSPLAPFPAAEDKTLLPCAHTYLHTPGRGQGL